MDGLVRGGLPGNLSERWRRVSVQRRDTQFSWGGLDASLGLHGSTPGFCVRRFGIHAALRRGPFRIRRSVIVERNLAGLQIQESIANQSKRNCIICGDTIPRSETRF